MIEVSVASLDCECRIYTVAKVTRLAFQTMVKKERPAAAERTTPNCYKVVSYCFQRRYHASNQSVSKCWSSWQNKVSHIGGLVSGQTTLQRVTSHVITNIVDTLLSNLGPKKKLICTSAKTNTSFTREQLFQFQADLSLSNMQTRVFAQDLRVVTGSRKVVKYGFKKNLTKTSHTVYENLK